MTSPWQRQLSSLFSPLALAAYVAIAVVWLERAESLAERAPANLPYLHAALAAYALGFMAIMRSDEVRWRFPLGAVLMSVSAPLVALLGPSGTVGILYVVLAAVLAAESSLRVLVVLLVLNNTVLAAVATWSWGAGLASVAQMVLGQASFQVFAALVMRYAAQAQRMSEQLRAVNADLLATRSLLAESARDSERLRLSRELHDVAGHKLTALKLNLAALRRQHGDGASADQVALCSQLADELLADIRNVVQRLRQDEGIDLGKAIAALAAPFPRPRLQLQIDAAVRVSSLAQAEGLLRTVQEALTNAARHGQAQNLWVVLLQQQGELRLDIRDDGRGHGPLTPGNGLRGMRERLEALGGGLQVQRGETGGVQLLARLPA
jgi:signal transduction histidine kinase